MIPRYIDPVSGRYVKVLNLKEVSKIRYRYKIRTLLQGVCINRLHAIYRGRYNCYLCFIVVVVKFNSSGLFTSVVSISSSGHAQAADIVLKYLYLLPDGVSGRYGKILSM